MGAIIVSIIAIIFCIIAIVIGLLCKDYYTVPLFFLLICLDVFSLVYHINKYNAKKNGDLEITVVSNVVSYSIDSTTVINGADTTKTYTLTYWKDYE